VAPVVRRRRRLVAQHRDRLFASPIDLVVAGLIGPIVVLLIDRRLPAIKVVFNIAQFTLSRSSWSTSWTE